MKFATLKHPQKHTTGGYCFFWLEPMPGNEVHVFLYFNKPFSACNVEVQALGSKNLILESLRNTHSNLFSVLVFCL